MLEVVATQRGQDADQRHPAPCPRAASRTRPPEQAARLLPQRGKRAAGQRRRRRIQLQVEPVQLQVDAGIGRRGADRLVSRERPSHLIDQEQLKLSAKRGRTHPEARPLQQPAQRRQALPEPLPKARVVELVERLLVDAFPHGRTP